MPATTVPMMHPLQDQGFIEHSTSHPLVLRKRPRSANPLDIDQICGLIGVSFFSEQHVAAGTKVVLEIPVSDDLHRFDGTVVFVRELERAFEIGVWLDRAEDTDRLRIVEEICLLEREQGIRPRVQPIRDVSQRPLDRVRQRAAHVFQSALPRSIARPAAESRGPEQRP